MRWNPGRATIDQMLSARQLQRVPASREHADRLVMEARELLVAAAEVQGRAPEGAYGMLYDAARKALTAILENQGLRPTTKGGHIAPYDAVVAQLDPPMGKIVHPFNWLRIQRNDMQYPAAETPPISPADVQRDLPRAREIINLAERVLDQMDVF